MNDTTDLSDNYADPVSSVATVDVSGTPVSNIKYTAIIIAGVALATVVTIALILIAVTVVVVKMRTHNYKPTSRTIR